MLLEKIKVSLSIGGVAKLWKFLYAILPPGEFEFQF